MTGANLDKSQSVAVVGIHIGVDLKYKAAEFIFIGLHNTCFGLRGAGRGRDFQESMQELAHPKVVEGTAKKDRSQFTLEISFLVELRIHTLHQFQLFAQGFRCIFRNMLQQGFVVDVLKFNTLFERLLIGGKQVEVLFKDVVHPVELGAVAHWPGRSEEHTSELQSRPHLVCRLLLEKKKTKRMKAEQ